MNKNKKNDDHVGHSHDDQNDSNTSNIATEELNKEQNELAEDRAEYDAED